MNITFISEYFQSVVTTTTKVHLVIHHVVSEPSHAYILERQLLHQALLTELAGWPAPKQKTSEARLLRIVSTLTVIEPGTSAIIRPSLKADACQTPEQRKEANKRDNSA